MSDRENSVENFIQITMVVSLIINTIFIVTLFINLSGDEGDIVNVAAFGDIICEQQNMTYDHRVINTPENKVMRVPTIYCKPSDTPLIDGIVKVKK
jgi:hypothetical protein